MMKLRRTQPQPIALDVGNDSVKMLQLAATPAGLRVAAAASRPRTGPAGGGRGGIPQFASALRQMLDETRFAGRNVVAALPQELIHLRTLRLAPRPGRDLPTAVRSAAAELF